MSLNENGNDDWLTDAGFPEVTPSSISGTEEVVDDKAVLEVATTKTVDKETVARDVATPEAAGDIDSDPKATEESTTEESTTEEKPDLEKQVAELQELVKKLNPSTNPFAKENEELKAKLADKEAQADKPPSEEEFLANFTKQFEEDPETALKEMVLSIRQQMLDKTQYNAATDEAVGKSILRNQEKVCRGKYEDYDTVMVGFIPQLQSDDTLVDKWNKQGRTAEAAYSLAKEMSEHREAMKDPEAYKRKLRAEWEAENKNEESNGQPDTLSDVSGSRGIKTKNKAKPNGQLNSIAEIESSLGW